MPESFSCRIFGAAVPDNSAPCCRSWQRSSAPSAAGTAGECHCSNTGTDTSDSVPAKMRKAAWYCPDTAASVPDWKSKTAGHLLNAAQKVLPDVSVSRQMTHLPAAAVLCWLCRCCVPHNSAHTDNTPHASSRCNTKVPAMHNSDAGFPPPETSAVSVRSPQTGNTSDESHLPQDRSDTVHGRQRTAAYTRQDVHLPSGFPPALPQTAAHLPAGIRSPVPKKPCCRREMQEMFPHRHPAGKRFSEHSDVLCCPVRSAQRPVSAAA